VPKLRSINGMVSAIRNKLPLSVAQNLYESLFLSRHNYGCSVFGTIGYGTTFANDSLEIIHRKMIKTVHRGSFAWDISNEDLYRRSRNSTLKNIRSTEALKIFHAIFYGTSPLNLLKLVNKSSLARGVDTGRVLILVIHRTNLIKHSFQYRSAVLWNQLGHVPRCNPSRNIFKHEINRKLTDAGG